MKKLLLILCALLGTVGAWAETYTIFNQAVGTFYDNYGTRASDKLSWTSGSNSGKSGFVISLTGSNVTLDKASNWALVVHSSVDEINYTMTLQAPDGYTITGYDLTAQIWSSSYPNSYTLTAEDETAQTINSTTLKTLSVTGLNTTSTDISIVAAASSSTTQKWLTMKSLTVTMEPTFQAINVTYELYDDGADTPTETQVEQVEKNSDVNIPSSWINYVYYSNISSEGTIGESDCTITVNRTSRTKITDLANLSNGKAYYIRNARGTWAIKNSEMSASATSDLTVNNANKFVLYNTGEEYYLFSVSENKFVKSDKSLSRTPQAITITATEDASYPWWFKFDDSHIFNGGNGFMVVDGWNTLDGGNKNYIVEAADFDESIITSLLSIEGEFATAIEQLRAINFGTGLNQYSFIGDYADYTATASSVINTLESAGASEDNLAIAQDMLAHYALNMPTTGFYRIKGATSNKYLASGLAANNKFNMTTAEDASTIFYYDGTKLVNFGSGMCNGVTTSAWAWVTEDAASEVTFQDGLTNGGYAIKTSGANFYDNGDNSNSADRGGNVTINTSQNTRYRSWYLTEIATLPVSISSVGYATFFCPVAVTIPNGVKAYYISTLSETEATLTEIEGTIPSSTAVVLIGSEGSYDFSIASDVDAISGNKLAGTAAAIEYIDGAYTLQTNKDNSSEVGLYPTAVDYLAGFKAYLPATAFSSEAKGFTFRFSDIETVINSISAKQNGTVFDLSGRRVSKPAAGLYIENGKKVAIK